MENITQLLDHGYAPLKVLAVYQSVHFEQHMFVEAYDVNKAGELINAHPLSIQETAELAGLLYNSTVLENRFIKGKQLIPENVIYIDPGARGHMIWYTPEQEVQLYFAEHLGIPDGKAWVPAMIWKAQKDKLSVFALAGKVKKPKAGTPLYHAPFLNVHQDGSVCMGNVDTDTGEHNNLETLMSNWEHSFWSSYFTEAHHHATKENTIQFWKGMINTGRRFNHKVLLPANKTIQDIL